MEVTTMGDHVRFFWQPGCTSCLRTKEFLVSRGVQFEAIDVANDPQGMRELERLGARGLPVVAIGDRWVFAQSTKEVASFVGVPLGGAGTLAPAILVQRLDGILSAALRFAHQVPPSDFRVPLPKRERTYGDLSWHIFRVAEAFLEAETPGGELTFAALAETIPDDIASPTDVTAYGSGVHRRILAWWDRETDRSGERLLRTFYGRQKLQDVLERTAWHSGQHLRQLMLVLDELGIEPDRRVGAAAFEGLPMPINVWDDKLQFSVEGRG
jgi:glutaredoxin